MSVLSSSFKGRLSAFMQTHWARGITKFETRGVDLSTVLRRKGPLHPCATELPRSDRIQDGRLDAQPVFDVGFVNATYFQERHFPFRLPNQLNAHGQAFIVKACWHVQGGQSSQCGIGDHFHPSMVGVHGLGATGRVDRLGPMGLFGKGPNLSTGQAQDVVLLQQTQEFLIQQASGLAGVQEINGLDVQARLDFPKRFGFHVFLGIGQPHEG